MIHKTGNGNLNLKKIKDTDILFIDGDRGKNYPSSNQIKNFGYCVFLDAKNITKNGFNIDKLNFITKEKDNVLRKGRLLPNDIIITTRGTLNNIALYSKEISKKIPNARINSGMVIMRLGDKYCPYFFEFFLRSSLWVKQCINSGGVIPQLTISKMVENYIIDVGIKEQQRIADVLSKQESIINKTKELINELDKRNTFMLDELLSGRLRIKDENGAITFYKNPEDNWQNVVMNGEEKQIPKDWEMMCLKDNLKIETGKKDANAGNKQSGLYSFFTCSRDVLRTNDFSFDCEAILMSGNGSVGEVKYFKGKFDAYQRTYILSNYKHNLKYLYHYLNVYFRDNLNILGATIPYIKMSHIQSFGVAIPSKEEEKNILDILEKISLEKEKYEELLIEEEKKFDFLLEELMSGRLRIEE